MMGRPKNSETKVVKEKATVNEKEVNKEVKTDEIDIEKLVEEKAQALLEEKLKEIENSKTDEVAELKENTEIKKEKSKRLFKSKTISRVEIADKKRMIPLVCMVNHRVGYKCALSNLFIVWDGKGDEHEISIEEAQLMYAEDENFLKNWLIADDEEFANAMNLTEIYSILFEIEDMERFYSQRMITIKNKLDSMPEGIRQEFLNDTAIKIVDGTLKIPEVLQIARMLKDDYKVEIEL